MDKLFKPGDKVQLKTGGPIMEVVKYVMRNNFLYPQHISTEYVECTYYSVLNKEWKTESFHQDNLLKVDGAVPAWAQSLLGLLNTHAKAVWN